VEHIAFSAVLTIQITNDIIVFFRATANYDNENY